MKKLLFHILLLLTPILSKAEHLIGGEMTYTCLGNNEYEIQLTIYMICNSDAGFDEYPIISWYDNQNNLVDDKNWDAVAGTTINEQVFPMDTDQIDDETVGNDCLELPAGLCIEIGTYYINLNLPPIDGGYEIVYQRCCRDPNIINIENLDP